MSSLSPERFTWCRQFAHLSLDEKLEFLKLLTDEEAIELQYTWPAWARDKQLEEIEALGDWVIWLLLAGRGFGKSRVGSEQVIKWAREDPHARIALVGRTAADVRDVMVEGESGILACSHPEFKPKYEPSKRRLTWPNGAIATTYSADEPDALRGPQHSKAWGDEPAAWKYTESHDNLMFGLRLGGKPQAVYTTTPRPTKFIKSLIAQKTTHVTKGTTYENLDNLAPVFKDQVVGRYEGTRIGRQELEAIILDDNERALWKRETMIENLRVTKAPDLKRIVVGVDPSVNDGTEVDNKDLAECGIIVGGLGIDNHGYLLDDKSLMGSPMQWAREAITAYHSRKADRIVAEVNNGGKLVEAVIRVIDRNVSYKDVHAARGKLTRAEPISSLAEQGRIHHVGTFPEVEDQMCNWEPGDKSPDRCFVAGTLIATERGEIPIENIQPGMKVWTRQGLKLVIKSSMTQEKASVNTILFSNGHTLTGTPNHPIYVYGKGFVALDSLVWGDIIHAWKEKQSCLTEQPSFVIQNHQEGTTGSIFGLTTKRGRGRLARVLSIERYGNFITGLFQRDARSTTSTGILSIMRSKILSALPRKSMQNVIRMNSLNNGASMLHRFAPCLLLGTLRRKELNGIGNTVKRAGKTERLSREFVLSVGLNMMASLYGAMKCSALALASPSGMRQNDDTTKIEPAQCADLRLTSRSQKSSKLAPVSVVGLYDAGNAPVYNLQVEDAHEYYAQGVLVHNCDAYVWTFTELMMIETEVSYFKAPKGSSWSR